MAFTVTARSEDASGVTAVATEALPAFTPTADSLLVVGAVGELDSFSAYATIVSCTSSPSLTFTERAKLDDTDAPLYGAETISNYCLNTGLWTAPVGGSPASTTVTFDMSSGVDYYSAACALDITGHNVASPVVQAAEGLDESNNGSNTVAVSVTLGSTATTGNLVVLFLGSSADSGGGFAAPTYGGQAMTEVHNQDNAYAQTGMWYRVVTGTESTNVLTCTGGVYTGVSVGGAAAFAIEIAAAAGGDATATPSTVAATAAVPAPTVTATSNATVTPAAVATTCSVLAPTVDTASNANVSPSTVAITGATPSPTVDAEQAANISADVVAGLVAIPPPSVVTAGQALYPESISGRKLLDQNSDPILIKTMSAWSMAVHLTDAQITSELEKIADNGFNSVTVFPWGSDYSALYSDWNDYSSSNGNLFTGTPFQSTLDTGWESMDWIVSECDRLGMFVNFSFGVGFDNSFAGDEMSAATNAQMVTFGEYVATRYAAATNIVWHVMFDYTPSVASTVGQRIEALFEGINNIEGTARPVRWLEVANGSTTNEGGWYNTTHTKATIDSFYEYNDTAADDIDAVYDDLPGAGSTAVPVMDCEPPYVGAPHYGGNEAQQLRERTWAVFLRGGIGINFGHEDYWPFGRSGLYTAGITWSNVQTHARLLDQRYAFSVIDAYVNDTAWAPTDSFVTTGEGTGDTRAAAGTSGTAALAYFPTSRTIQVDTTILTGTVNVRLRWYDPSDGTYTSIATSEAQQTGRTVTHPGTNTGGQADWVLVVDVSGDATATPSTITATAAFPAASASATSTATATPSTVTATVTVPAPTVGAGAGVAPSTVAKTVAVPNPVATVPAAGTYPVIGSNTVTTAQQNNFNNVFNYPAHSTGDLVVIAVEVAAQSNLAGVTGPNGETVTGQFPGTGQFGNYYAGIIYWVSTGDEAAGTITMGTQSNQSSAVAFTVDAGTFSTADPIGNFDSTNATLTYTPSFNSGTAQTNGLIMLAYGTLDALPIGFTFPSGWSTTVAKTNVAFGIGVGDGNGYVDAGDAYAPGNGSSGTGGYGGTLTFLISSPNAAPDAVAATASVPAPSVSTSVDQSVSASTVTATVSVPAPSVTATSTATAAPATITATASVLAPDVTTGTIITPATVEATATVPSQTAGAGIGVSVSTVTATAAIPAPSVQRPEPDTVTALAAVPAPTVTVGISVSVLPACFFATAVVHLVAEPRRTRTRTGYGRDGYKPKMTPAERRDAFDAARRIRDLENP